MKCSLGITNILEDISSLCHTIVFLFSLHRSLRKAFLSLHAIPWNSAFKWVYLSFSFNYGWMFDKPFIKSKHNLHWSLTKLLWAKLLQSCLTLCDLIDCSPPGCCVHKILQARVMELVTMPSSRGIFPTQRSNPHLLHCIRGFFTHWTTWEALLKSTFICYSWQNLLTSVSPAHGHYSTSLMSWRV